MIPAPGPVNCQITHREDGSRACGTHGIEWPAGTPIERVREHIREANQEWHRQQDALKKVADVAASVGIDMKWLDDKMPFLRCGKCRYPTAVRMRDGTLRCGQCGEVLGTWMKRMPMGCEVGGCTVPAKSWNDPKGYSFRLCVPHAKELRPDVLSQQQEDP